ncbi:MAG: N-acetylglucosamine-6-phosphate deacetylase [Deferribacteres bacterium]|nr:N-acetylglucosamine-6-phosphate deacetylase [Deferribacteres bacterium]
MEIQYIDLQVNGYAGVDFNSDVLSAEMLHKSCAQLKIDNVAGILATVITADIPVMQARLQRLVSLRQQDPLIAEIIKGFHIEGPFLSAEPGFRGAHPQGWIREANVDDMKRLLDAADGLTKIVTLAPEMDDDFKVIRFLSGQNMWVSAGHCNPDYDQLRAAIDAGVSMFTHLGNGCPQILPRHDNIIERALACRDDLWLCFIADGIHIPFFALRNYLKIAGTEKTIIVSDAMAAAAAPPGQYRLSELELEVGEDRIVRELGKENFAGSACTMSLSYENLINHVNCTPSQAKKITFENPLAAIA